MQKTVAIALPEEPDTAVKRFPRELLYLCTILLMLVALVAGYCFWVMSKLPKQIEHELKFNWHFNC